MQSKHVPLRKCVGCGEMKPKSELVRVVRTPEGEICVDPTGKKNGRGVYVCRDALCLEKARKARRIESAFSCRIEPEIYERLKGGIADADR